MLATLAIRRSILTSTLGFHHQSAQQLSLPTLLLSANYSTAAKKPVSPPPKVAAASPNPPKPAAAAPVAKKPVTPAPPPKGSKGDSVSKDQAKKKEKEREKKEQEKEKERAAKEREKEKDKKEQEKERAAKEREREKKREKAERMREKDKEQAEKERERKKARAVREKESAAKEKLKVKKAKVKQLLEDEKRDKTEARIAEKKKKEATPKRPRTGYMFFAQETRPTVLREKPGLPVTEVMKEVAKRWAAAQPDARAKYEKLSAQDKVRHEKELVVFKQKYPDPPKRGTSSFAFYVKAMLPQMKKQHENLTMGEVVRIVAKQWKAISASEKKKYEQLAIDDKARYEREKDKFEQTNQ